MGVDLRAASVERFAERHTYSENTIVRQISLRQWVWVGIGVIGVGLVLAAGGCSSDYDEKPTAPGAAGTAATAPKAAVAEPGILPQVNPTPGVWIPEWAGKDTNEPFDVKAYLESRAVAPADNAAPLYLAALASFAGYMYLPQSECTAEWPWKKEATPKEAEELGRAIVDAFEKVEAGSAPEEQVAAVLSQAQPMLKKLDEAQRRLRCVFVTGLRIDAQLPHAQAARGVARLAVLQLYHARQKGDIDEARQSVRRILRLSRDLRPRGHLVTQLVSFTVDGMVLSGVLDFTLSQPGLDPKGCDKLLAIVLEHEKQAVNPWDESLRIEYILDRNCLDSLEKGQVAPKEFARRVAELSGSPMSSERLEQFSQPNWQAELAACDAAYKMALAMKVVPYDPATSKQWEEDNIPKMRSQNANVMLMLMPSIQAIQKGVVQWRARLAGTKSLIAVRRYQLAHKELPADLATAAREAKLEEVPTDPYSGQPMHYKAVDDKPVVYSVGEDGKDDGGEVEWDKDKGTGDIIFRIRE
jgi:hypothetical protein